VTEGAVIGLSGAVCCTSGCGGGVVTEGAVIGLSGAVCCTSGCGGGVVTEGAVTRSRGAPGSFSDARATDAPWKVRRVINAMAGRRRNAAAAARRHVLTDTDKEDSSPGSLSIRRRVDCLSGQPGRQAQTALQRIGKGKVIVKCQSPVEKGAVSVPVKK
jgi:hypothetical protein